MKKELNVFYDKIFIFLVLLFMVDYFVEYILVVVVCYKLCYNKISDIVK